MTGSEFVKFHEETCKALTDLVRKKNEDYGGGAEVDAFTNFKMVEDFGVTSAEVGFFTRLTDKLARLSSFIKKGNLQNESVYDTLDDIANYAILMRGMLKDKEKSGNNKNDKGYITVIK